MSLSMETLHILAYAADWMAHESTTEDRDGRDTTDLRQAADEARKEALLVALAQNEPTITDEAALNEYESYTEEG